MEPVKQHKLAEKLQYLTGMTQVFHIKFRQIHCLQNKYTIKRLFSWLKEWFVLLEV